jgi:tetratricopeptide (TPR) repeat protein
MPSLRHLLPASLLALVLSPAAAGAAHPHYERLLRQGSFALERGEPAEAVRELRLACFGFLEEPPALADCLMRLALAQAAAGDEMGFRDAFRRIVEVEERFEAYSQAQTPAEMRSAFEAEVAARIPPRILAETPVFEHLAPPPDDVAAQAAPAPGAGAPAPAGDPAPAVVAPAPVPEPLDADAEARLAKARNLLAQARTRDDLEEPWRLAREVADANPQSRRAQQLAAVIAYRATRWTDAVTYFRRAGEPDESAPEVLFYFAVSLYESGEPEAAADVLRRSLPRIDQTPFVLSYRDKILGPPGAPDGH